MKKFSKMFLFFFVGMVIIVALNKLSRVINRDYWEEYDKNPSAYQWYEGTWGGRPAWCQLHPAPKDGGLQMYSFYYPSGGHICTLPAADAYFLH